MIYPQMLLDLHGEILVDLFAGGGGASCGIEMALGRTVDVAVNHDAAAVSLHQVNHPQTRHHVSDVFEVDPRTVTEGRRVGLLWASPDCTFHSKARGGKPIRSKERKRRALAWVVTRWAGQMRPRVIMLENVEEFADWGPLVGPPHAQRPCPRRKGRTFRKWVRSLERLGYQVEWRELRACDYGAPTIRKRLFLIARCDGRPIVWPEATHGPGTRRPYRTAAECIDWSIPMLSIFATREEAKAWARAHRQGTPVRPLAEATMRRIARGVMRFVVENPEPYVVGVGGRAGQSPERSTRAPYQTVTAKGDAAVVAPIVVPVQNAGSAAANPGSEPLRTITAHPKGGGFALAAPVIVPNNTNNAPHSPDAPVPTVTGGGRNILAAASLIQTGYGEREGQAPRALDIEAPLGTVVGGAAKHALVAAHLSSYHAEKRDGEARGSALSDPVATIDTSNRHALVGAFLAKHFTGVTGSPLSEPKGTVTTVDHDSLVAANLTHYQTGEPAGGSSPADPARAVLSKPKAGLVYSFLQKYYGQGIGQEVGEPAPTVTTKDRMGLVTVDVAGEPYVIADIAMRMLQPRELYNAQGFPAGYVIDRGADGRRLTKTEQVRMCGNSVCPPIAAALARANVPEMIARDEARRSA